MEIGMNNFDINKEFEEFRVNRNVNSPVKISEKLLDHVRNEMNPSHLSIFGKLVCIQGVIGVLTLLFCPQFDLSLTNNYDLFHYFHENYGQNACMAICGAIFIGSGAIFAAHTLSLGEIAVIKESKFLYYSAISLFAVACLMIFGADVYLQLAIFWLIGANIAGTVFFEINRHLRLQILKFS